MAIMIHPHARERMEERGVTENEVESARDGKFYRKKQVQVYGVNEVSDFIVITVVVRYF